MNFRADFGTEPLRQRIRLARISHEQATSPDRGVDCAFQLGIFYCLQHLFECWARAIAGG